MVVVAMVVVVVVVVVVDTSTNAHNVLVRAQVLVQVLPIQERLLVLLLVGARVSIPTTVLLPIVA